MIRYLLYTFILIVFSLSVGATGYHYLGKLDWVESVYNASMILTGMGPVDKLESDGAKIFASIYAVYCGVAFLSSVAVLLGPLVHRVLHKYHMDMEDGE